MAGLATNALPITNTPGPPILRLPNELLDRITECADTADLLNLRRAGNKRLSQSALDTKQKRITTIYIEHSRKSLERFREICASPSHARQIKEVRYLASIRTKSFEDIDTNQRRWELFDQVNAFGQVIEGQNVSDDLVNEVLNVYQEEKEEQSALIEQDELCATMRGCLKRLPNLNKITLCDRPQIDGNVKNEERVWTKQKAPIAYNRLRHWRDGTDTAVREDLKHLSPEEFARDQLLFTAQYEMTAGFDDLQCVIRSIADLAHHFPARPFQLAIAGPLTVLNEQWEHFVNQNQRTVDSALQNVKFIDIKAELRWKNKKCQPGTFAMDLSILPRWERLLSSAIHVRKLTLDGYSEEIFPFAKAVVERVTFPELEHLVLETYVTLWEHQSHSYTEGPSRESYTAQALGEFLLRHRHTLKTVHLRSASGAETPFNRPSAVSFGGLLELMKSSLPHLQSATVLESHHVFYQEDREPTWGEGTPYGHLLPGERDRAREQDSDIGRLARKCGITPLERPIGRGPGNADGETTQCTGGKYGYGTLNRALAFQYDFGPYVVDDPTRRPFEESWPPLW